MSDMLAVVGDLDRRAMRLKRLMSTPKEGTLVMDYLYPTKEYQKEMAERLRTVFSSFQVREVPQMLREAISLLQPENPIPYADHVWETIKQKTQCTIPAEWRKHNISELAYLFQGVKDLDADTPALGCCICACVHLLKEYGHDSNISLESWKEAANLFGDLEEQTVESKQLFLLVATTFQLLVNQRKDIDKLTGKLNKANERVEALRKKPTTVKTVYRQVGQKKLDAAMEENRKLKKQLAAYQHDTAVEESLELKRKNAYIAALEQRFIQEALQMDENVNVSIEELPTIPDKGVCIINGHGHVHTKLAELYPNWTFFNSRNFVPPSGTKFGVVLTSFGDHATYQRFKQNMKDIPIIYANSVNVDRILLEIRLQLLSLEY